MAVPRSQNVGTTLTAEMSWDSSVSLILSNPCIPIHTHPKSFYIKGWITGGKADPSRTIYKAGHYLHTQYESNPGKFSLWVSRVLFSQSKILELENHGSLNHRPSILGDFMIHRLCHSIPLSRMYWKFSKMYTVDLNFCGIPHTMLFK